MKIFEFRAAPQENKELARCVQLGRQPVSSFVSIRRSSMAAFSGAPRLRPRVLERHDPIGTKMALAFNPATTLRAQRRRRGLPREAVVVRQVPGREQDAEPRPGGVGRARRTWHAPPAAEAEEAAPVGPPAQVVRAVRTLLCMRWGVQVALRTWLDCGERSPARWNSMVVWPVVMRNAWLACVSDGRRSAWQTRPRKRQWLARR